MGRRKPIDISANSPALSEMELNLNDIIDKYKVNLALENLRENINRLFDGVTCSSLTIFNNNTKNHFFGAKVVPSLDELDRISAEITRNGIGNREISLCNEFMIELDSKLLYEIDASADELVAVILHELGHKIFSDDVYNDIE